MAKTIAILLSGGKGSRLGKLGRQIPKPLIPIGDQPVINTVVDKLLRLTRPNGEKAIHTIYVLLRTEQRLDPTRYDDVRFFNLREHFEGWHRIWYGPPHPDEDRIETLYEEELDPELSVPKEGAIAGLLRFLRSRTRLDDVDRVIVIAADNYFPEDDLTGFLRLGSNPRITINGYKDLVDPERVRGKFGCIFLDREWVTGFEEKPLEVTEKHHLASVGLYSFPLSHFKKIEDYAREPDASLGSPGEFIAWLARHLDCEVGKAREEGVKGYPIQGPWFDIGDPTDLKIAYFWYVHSVLGQVTTVEDLLVARATNRVDDRTYLVCRSLCLSGSRRTIRIFFKATDRLCSLRADSRNLQTVQHIARESAGNRDLWERLSAAIEGPGDFNWSDPAPPKGGDPPDLGAQILLSAGVFLFDTDRRLGGRLPRARALVPLLEKDASSRTDPRRVTTAAGRMDDLDFQQVCADELLEEFIFFGRERDHRTRIYCPRFRSDRRRELLERIARAKMVIPGIALEDVERELESKTLGDDLIVNVSAEVVDSPLTWRVEVYLGREDELTAGKMVYDLMYVRDGFLIIADQENNTLELRLVCSADLFGSDKVDETRMQVGNIRGILDGDGFQRTPLLIRASELEGYYALLSEKAQKEDLLKLLNRSQREVVELWAIGDGFTGQFSRFQVKMPALFLTSSVEYLARNLPHLLV